jgi:hypothetical protein
MCTCSPTPPGAERGRPAPAARCHLHGIPAGPAEGRGPRGRPRLHQPHPRAAGRGHRSDRAAALGLLLSTGHPLHRQARRRPPRRPGHHPYRWHPPRPLPELTQRARTDGVRHAVRTQPEPSTCDIDHPFIVLASFTSPEGGAPGRAATRGSLPWPAIRADRSGVRRLRCRRAPCGPPHRRFPPR